MKDGCDFAVEWREAAFVLADSFLIDPNIRPIVGSADVKERAHIGLGLVSEIALIPEHTLVAKQCRILRVPVPGNFERGRCCEVVFLHSTFAHQGRVLVHPVSAVMHGSVRAVKASSCHVDEVVPVAIEAGSGTVVHIDQQRVQRLLRKARESNNEVETQGKAEESKIAGTKDSHRTELH
jgi:hypothetical protein